MPVSVPRIFEVSVDFDHGHATLDATPFLYQLKTVVARNNTALWRSPDYVFSRLFVHAIVSLCISLSFLQLGNSVRDLQYRVFGMSVIYISIFLSISLTGYNSVRQFLDCRFTRYSDGTDRANVHTQQKSVCISLLFLLTSYLLSAFITRGIHSRFVPCVEADISLVLITPTESSSRIYSPYVFAIGQLIGEIPYSLLCAILYWVFMVCKLEFSHTVCLF